MKKEYVIPINEKKEEITTDDIKNTIEYFLKNIKDKNAYKEIAFFGESFTKLDIEKQEKLLDAVYEYVKGGKIDSVRVSANPEHINKQMLKMLKKYKVQAIELDVQSANDYILKKAERTYTFADVKKVSKMIRWRGFKLGLQMMVGLPESTKIDDMNTAKALLKLKPKMIRVYPVLVMKGTELEKDYSSGKYVPITLVQAVETCMELVAMFNKKKIETIRIGLQTEEETTDKNIEKSEVVAGPYHPAFRQLVESGLWYDAIVSKIKKLNVKVKEVEVTVNPIDASNVIGYKNENVTKLKDLYDVDLVLKQEENMKQGDSKIEITKTYNDFLED